MRQATMDVAVHGATGRSPAGSRLIAGLALLSALSAVGGGLGLLTGQIGDAYVPPMEALAHSPFGSFLVPGALLGGVVGGTSLVAAVLAWRRARGAVEATLLAGGALTIWILVEVALLRAVHGLQVAYGVLGLTLLGLGVRAAWRSGEPRHRWLVLVTLAEAAGFFVPACVGVLSARAGVGEGLQALLVVAAGAVEGLALGAGQALAFPLPVRRLRYALLTAAGAGVVWGCVMTMMQLAGGLATGAAILLGTVGALVGLGVIGAAQWVELRHHTPQAHRWIGWTALAWALALPWSFAPGPFVDASTPLAASLALWGCGGLLMAFTMALLSWQGVRRLPAVRDARARGEALAS